MCNKRYPVWLHQKQQNGFGLQRQISQSKNQFIGVHAMLKALSDPDVFKAFMQHLAAEFAMVCYLYYVGSLCTDRDVVYTRLLRFNWFSS